MDKKSEAARIFKLAEKNPLFEGIGFGSFEQLFICLSARTVRFKRDDIILLSGDTVIFVGLVLSGRIKIIKEDAGGNSTILTELYAPEIFGEILACAEIKKSPVTITATEPTEVLLIDNKRIISPCASACSFHTRLVENMLRLVAKKNFMLNRKIEILSKRTTQEKILCFFELYSQGAKEFTIPFSREEMAHYLCVDRSAMSYTLCKMRDEGLIKFHKNKFELL